MNQEMIVIVVMMNLVVARRKNIMKRCIKTVLVLVLFMHFSACNDGDNSKKALIDMEHVNVHFEPLNKKFSFSILKPAYALKYIDSNSGKMDDELSSRFKSKVYKFDDGKLLEIRKLGLVEDCKLYNNLEELLFCRKVFTVSRHDTKERIYDIKCTKDDVDFLVTKYGGVPDPKLKEDTRAAIRLNNGQYVIAYRTGDGVLFNSLADLQYVSPFDSFDDDYEDVFVSREANLYISAGSSVKAMVIEKDSAKKLKINKDKLKIGTGIVLADGKILDKVNNQVFVLFSSKTEYEKLISNRTLKTPYNDLIVLNGKEDGLVSRPEDFLKFVGGAKKIISEKLNIEITRLDGSLESLNLLDAEINKYLCDKYFVSELSLPIVVYVGEVLKSRAKGTWSFEKYEPTKYFRAFIKNPDGTEIDFISAIFSEFKNQISTGDFASYAVASGR